MDIDEALCEIRVLRGLVGSGLTELQMSLLHELGDILHGKIDKESRQRAIEIYYRIMDFAKYKGE